MSFLDKAKKLAEQAAEKAGPLIDKAAPHAQNVVDKAGQQIDRRTGGKYHDKIEAVEAKVGELAEKRMAGRGGAGTADGSPAAGAPDAAPGDAFPTPGAAGTGPAGAADAFPGSGAADAAPAGAADGFPARPAPVEGVDGTVPTRTGSLEDFGSTPAQPDLSGGQPDGPAHSGAAAGGFPAAEPAFSAQTPDITYPAPAPDVSYPAEPDSRAGQSDDPTHSLSPGGTSEFPGLSEAPAGTPGTEADRHSGPAAGGSGSSNS